MAYNKIIFQLEDAGNEMKRPPPPPPSTYLCYFHGKVGFEGKLGGFLKHLTNLTVSRRTENHG